MDCTMPGFSVHQKSWAYSNTYPLSQSCHPTILSSPSPPTFSLSQHQGFSNELLLHIRCPKYWRFSFSISPSNEYSGLISFRMDWLDLRAVKGLPRVFFNTTVQKHQFSALTFLYSPSLTSKMTTGKTIDLTKQTFVGKVMSLLFNMLSRLVITFLPRSKHLLISWLQSPSVVISVQFSSVI